MEAEDPRYKIRLVNGATFWTDMRESWLEARWAQGQGTEFAEEKDDPFEDLRADPNLCFGSYGLHIDSQLDALEKVVQAKAFAKKAVKADDAEVPVHLWNNQIRVPGVPEEQRDIALNALHKLCQRQYLRGLL